MTAENSRPWQGAADANGDDDQTTVEPITDIPVPVGESATKGITIGHRRLLEDSAIPVEFALAREVYSAAMAGDLPYELRIHAGALPGLVFPWLSPGGETHYQLRPDTPAGPEGASKYLQPAGVRLLNVLPGSEPAQRVLIVEGTKQCLAARVYARPDELVIGIPGCANGMKDGQLLPGLDDLIEDLPVTLIFDADLATKPQVRRSAMALRDALLAAGATSCGFAVVPGVGNTGLDDFLGGRMPEKRAKALARIVTQAKEQPPKQSKRVEDAVLGRPTVEVNNDRLVVISEATTYLLDRYDGERLFNHGGVLAELIGHQMKPLTKNRFLRLAAEGIYFYATDSQGNAEPAWPDDKVVGAVWEAAEAFTPLSRITRVPFVRPDGTLRLEAGYDTATQSLLMLDQELEGTVVPSTPTAEDVRRAEALLLEEWLGDMPLHQPADRANLLALILTPFLRDLVPLAPLAVIDGLMMGVGKNLLADCLAIVVTGSNIDPLPFPGNDDELRKMITSNFGTGASLFVFDEAHVLKGASLARALTAVTYTDRILGHSRMGSYPNRVTWMALGNQVQVHGDIARRVYRIALRPKEADPERRTNFSKPDLRQWTRDNRKELVEAILTLIRAWFAAGSPAAPITMGFGSFEQWQRITGGIVAHAGLPDFLGNTRAWRSESDFDTTYWQDHLLNVERVFGTGNRFIVRDVVDAMHDRDVTEFPPALYNYTTISFPRELGQSYGRIKDRWFGDIRLVKDGSPGGGGAHRSVAAWKIEKRPTEDTERPPTEGSEGSEGSGINPYPAHATNIPRPVGTSRSEGTTGASLMSSPHPPYPSGPSDPSGPSIEVTWDDAADNRMGQLLRDVNDQGLRVDVPLLAERKQNQDRATRNRNREINRLLGLSGAAAARSRPWTTAEGTKRFADLAGPDWPRLPDGQPQMTREVFQVGERSRDHRVAQLCSLLAEAVADGQFVTAVSAHLVDTRIYPTYSADTVTGRWTSREPNVFGTGRRTPQLLAERDLIIAEPGEVFIGADLSGIEARCVAGLSGDRAYAALFEPGRDIHLEMSVLFFGDTEHREQAKTITHGLNYGRGATTIAEQTGLPLADVRQMINRYFERYPALARWQTGLRTQAEKGLCLTTGTGRKVVSDPDRAHTTAPARVAQACARDLAMTGLFRMEQSGLLQRLRMFLHDEVVLSTQRAAASGMVEEVVNLMSFDWKSPSGLIIPIVAHPAKGYGPRWSDLYR